MDASTHAVLPTNSAYLLGSFGNLNEDCSVTELQSCGGPEDMD